MLMCVNCELPATSVSELLSQEQDFRRYCCPGMGDDVHELQSVPQQFPDDKDEADVASPGDLKSKHGSSASHRTEQAFATNGRKFLEFEPALMHFTSRRGFCGAQLLWQVARTSM